jgi:hypothetical protein
MKEKDFDKIVQHTLRIELTDGSTLLYPILPKEKGELITVLRSLAFGDPEGKPAGMLCFNVFPGRTVFINTRYLLNIIFCFDHLAAVGPPRYRDNFGVVHVETTDHSTEEKDATDSLPSVILKLSHPLPLQESQVASFYDIEPGTLANLDIEAWEPQDGVRQFIELEDEDGEANFFNLEYVMCIEAAQEVVNEEEMDADEDE